MSDEYAKSLVRVSAIATGATDARAEIEGVAGEVAGLFDTGMASIYLCSDEGTLKHASGFGVPPHFVRKLDESGTAEWAVTLFKGGPRPLILEDAQKASPTGELTRWAASIGVETLALAPLLCDGKPMGVLVLYHHRKRPYTEQERNILQVMAGLTAQIVEKAHIVGASGATNSKSSKSQLFSVLSHELRTPLTSIMGFTQIIRKKIASAYASDKRLLEQLDILWAQAQRLNRLIDTFVDLSRIERGEFQIARGQVDLTALIRAAVAQATAQDTSRHKVDVHLPDENLRLHGDGKRLEQVFNNVITNALHYSPREQPVVVSSKAMPDAGQVLVTVTDKGPGIPDNRLKDIFDRDHASGPLKAGGLGVGLYMSKVIVEAHGGQISIDSLAGHGTTVSIALPV